MIKLIKNKINIENRKFFIVIAIFSLINILFLTVVFPQIVSPFVSDSYEYQETAKYLIGYKEAEIFPHRLLKPITPLLFGVASFFVDIKNSFILINSFFYFFIGFLVFKITNLIFNDKQCSLISSMIFLSAYPILEYGLAYMTDLSGWFFFALSVYLTLLFIKQPNFNLVVLNGFISVLGIFCKESGGMGVLFFMLCLFFSTKESVRNKIKYFILFTASFIVPFLLWQIFIYFNFNYSYYDWFLFNRGAGSSIYKDEVIKLMAKSLGASFLFGWIFAIIGFFRVMFADNVSYQSKKELLFLIPSSLSFLMWFAASSRLFYIIGILLSILAGYGIVSLTRNKIFQNLFLFFVLLVNYFWLVFDNDLRVIINYFFNIHY